VGLLLLRVDKSPLVQKVGQHGAVAA
jgi:hypothetical protein